MIGLTNLIRYADLAVGVERRLHTLFFTRFFVLRQARLIRSEEFSITFGTAAAPLPPNSVARQRNCGGPQWGERCFEPCERSAVLTVFGFARRPGPAVRSRSKAAVASCSFH